MGLTFVTTNMGKANEVRSLLRALGIEIDVRAVKLTEIQSDSLEEISMRSCEEAYGVLGEPVFVEDAGLFIERLNGFPGPYSSYVYRTIGNAGILKLMAGEENRVAYFKSCIAYKLSGKPVKMFSGVCVGRISHEPRGSGGFGFDPIFMPEEGDGRTFAEMEIEEKNAISHRGKAVRAFAEWLKLTR
ncbi:MAG: XTP/dITP diphosphatase [Nitrososphaerota archaeon]